MDSGLQQYGGKKSKQGKEPVDQLDEFKYKKQGEP